MADNNGTVEKVEEQVKAGVETAAAVAQTAVRTWPIWVGGIVFGLVVGFFLGHYL